MYDAKRGLAELAREVWRDQALADRLEREADELRARFDEAFWVDERGGFYALALDGKKRRVDSRCSNMGHLLWSGIVLPERVGAVVDQLLSEELWSGWGIRTMASDAAAFNPISYHNGTVWPHDSALAAWGLARHGYVAEARRIARALDRGRGATSTGRCRRCSPATRATRRRSRSRIRPRRVRRRGRPARRSSSSASSSASSPTARGSGSSRPSTDELPSWLDGLRIEGVRAYGRTWTVAVERGHVTIAEGV